MWVEQAEAFYEEVLRAEQVWAIRDEGDYVAPQIYHAVRADLAVTTAA